MASSMGVWQAYASLRARRNDFKLAVSDASSMKGVSTMQKGTKMKTFLPSPRRERVSRNEDDGLGRFDGQHGLRLNRLYCLSMEIHYLDGLGALSSVFAALRQLQLRAV